MNKPSLVIVILEDGRQQMSIRRYLIKCGLTRHEIRFQQSPSGRGSAENWVRKRFVVEANMYRTRRARAKTALIVMIDADTHTVQDRFNQLDQALSGSGNQIVDEGEQIARLVPKRNIETWILCLNGQAVNEDSDYKTPRNDWNEIIPRASETLHKWTRPNFELPDHCVSSLQTGVQELKRLTF